MINFSDKENITKLIELEKISLTSTLDIQKNLNKQILIFIKNIQIFQNINCLLIIYIYRNLML